VANRATHREAVAPWRSGGRSLPRMPALIPTTTRRHAQRSLTQTALPLPH
jgi:hypothetical protein